MTDQPSDLIERYVSIKQQISQLEAELDAIKDAVFQSVSGEGGEIAQDAFVLKTSKRPKYKFSAEYEQKNSDLKALRKSEIDSGTATIESYSEFVTVRFKK